MEAVAFDLACFARATLAPVAAAAGVLAAAEALKWSGIHEPRRDPSQFQYIRERGVLSFCSKVHGWVWGGGGLRKATSMQVLLRGVPEGRISDLLCSALSLSLSSLVSSTSIQHRNRLQPTLSFAAEGEKLKTLNAIFTELDDSADGQIEKKELLKG